MKKTRSKNSRDTVPLNDISESRLCLPEVVSKLWAAGPHRKEDRAQELSKISIQFIGEAFTVESLHK
jgi:hypothetical protein